MTLVEKLIKELKLNAKKAAAIALIAGASLSMTGCVVDWSHLGNSQPTKKPVKDETKVTESNKTIELDPDMKYKVANDIAEMAEFIADMKSKNPNDTTYDNSTSSIGYPDNNQTTSSNYTKPKDYYDVTMPDTLDGEVSAEENNPTIDTKDNIGGNVTTPGGLVSEETTTSNTTSQVTSKDSSTTTSTKPIDFNTQIDLIKKSVNARLSSYATANKVSQSALPNVDEIVFIKPSNNFVQVGFIDRANGNFIRVNFSSAKSSNALSDLNKFNNSNSKADAEKFATSCILAIDTSTIKSGNIIVSTMVEGLDNSLIASKNNKDPNSNFIVCFDNVDPVKKSNGTYEYSFTIITVGKTSVIAPMDITEGKVTTKSKLSRRGLIDEISSIYSAGSTVDSSVNP